MSSAAKQYFDGAIKNDWQFLKQFTDDTESVIREATAEYDQLVPLMPYADDPKHPMAGSMFFCAMMLAIYLPLRSRGVDVHDFGRRALTMIGHVNRQNPAPATTEAGEKLIEAAKASQVSAADNEFVFEAENSDADDEDWRMNVKRCAICSLYSKRDAMDLVPYMCASDDIVSDIGGQGLRRTGSIALGAHQCDFVYKAGGEGSALSGQYPDRIQLTPTDR